MMCESAYADFERRMIAEWEAVKAAASEVGDLAKFEKAEQEAENYREMLKQSLAACPCKGKCAADGIN